MSSSHKLTGIGKVQDPGSIISGTLTTTSGGGGVATVGAAYTGKPVVATVVGNVGAFAAAAKVTGGILTVTLSTSLVGVVSYMIDGR